MRAKGLMLITITAALVAGFSGLLATAAEKPGKPLNIKPTAAAQPSASAKPSDDWRDRAMKSRAEFAPDSDGAVPLGRSRALDERGDVERGDQGDGDEVGAGALGQDRGEGGGNTE